MIYNRILPGNNIETLKTLPDGSVDCCVTSPPYFNLRDYGTAIWIGGDSSCNHFRDNKIVDGDTFSSDYHPKGDMIYKSICKKCGAIREDNQIGLEATPEEYVDKLIILFREVYRVLKSNGTCWVNIGDSYNGSGKNNGNTKVMCEIQASNTASHNVKPLNLKTLPPKSLIGIPWRFAFAMIEAGWILRQDIIWSKPSVMPESVKDRFCKSHEYIFLFTKRKNYYFNHEFALEPATGYDGRKEETVARGEFDSAAWGATIGERRERCPQRGYVNKEGSTGLPEQHHGVHIPTRPLRTKRSVWTVASEPSNINHFAMFPQRLILPCIMCGCPENGIVLDPFIGSGTTALVAMKNLRKWIGCEINPNYVKIAEARIANEKGLFDD